MLFYIPMAFLFSFPFFGGFNCIMKNKWLDESPYDNNVYKRLINQAEHRLKQKEKHLNLDDLNKVAQEIKVKNKDVEYVYILSAVIYEQEKRVRNTLPKEIKKWIRKHPKEMAVISYA